MNSLHFFAFVWISSFLTFLVSGIRMVCWLRSRSVKINYFLIRFLLYKYAEQYKRMTLQETGRVGPLYDPFKVGFYSMIFSTIVLVILTR